jgi:phosphoglycolate phosphatase
MRPMLIVFDLDGTLVDSRRDLADSTNDVLASYGAAPVSVDEVAGMVGEGAKVLVERALRAAGLDPDEPDALGRFRDFYDQRLLNHTRPYDGMPGVLDELHRQGHALAVLTNKPQAPSERLIGALGLAHYFQQVIGGDTSIARKPEPAGLHELRQRASAKAHETWLVGDSMIDVETARRAGVRMCVALYGFGQLRGELVLDGTETVVTRPAEIPRALGVDAST